MKGIRRDGNTLLTYGETVRIQNNEVTTVPGSTALILKNKSEAVVSLGIIVAFRHWSRALVALKTPSP